MDELEIQRPSYTARWKEFLRMYLSVRVGYLPPAGNVTDGRKAAFIAQYVNTYPQALFSQVR